MAPRVQVGSHHGCGRGIPHAGQGVTGDGLTLCPVCPVCPCPDCCRRTALYQIIRHPLSRHPLMLPRSWWRAHASATGEPAWPGH